MAPVDVETCQGIACFTVNVSYTAPMGQIKELISLSTECHQEIEVRFHSTVQKL